MSILERQDFVVGCTQEQAFDFLSDLRNELTWNPEQCQSVEKVTDGPIGVGTVFRAKWRGGPEIEVEYTEFDRPHSWRAQAPGSMETDFHCSIEDHEDGARVVSELQLIPHGFFKLVFPIFKLFFTSVNEVPEKIRSTLHKHYGVAEHAG